MVIMIILRLIADKLREFDYIPIIFDFDPPKGCDGQEKQETKLSFIPPFLIFNCFSNSNGLK
jgi:hypothetical protein